MEPYPEPEVQGCRRASTLIGNSGTSVGEFRGMPFQMMLSVALPSVLPRCYQGLDVARGPGRVEEPRSVSWEWLLRLLLSRRVSNSLTREKMYPERSLLMGRTGEKSALQVTRRLFSLSSPSDSAF